MCKVHFPNKDRFMIQWLTCCIQINKKLSWWINFDWNKKEKSSQQL